MAEGLPNKSIARSIGLADGTVKVHVAAVLRALGARNRTHAVREARRRGLLAGPVEGGYDDAARAALFEFVGTENLELRWTDDERVERLVLAALRDR